MRTQEEIIEKINFAIKASNTNDPNDSYIVGFKNGLRFARYLIDDKPPVYENQRNREDEHESE